MSFTLTFIELFLWVIYLTAPLILFLTASITAMGLLVSKLEQWPKGDAIYWAFITATTVGYGDIRPHRPLSRMLSVIIAIQGLIMTGIIVAIALHSASAAFDIHGDPELVKALEQRYEKSIKPELSSPKSPMRD